MYDDGFICTYKLLEDEYQEALYRTQFLQAFNLKTWDDNLVEERISNVYEQVKNIPCIQDLLDKAKKSKHLEILVLFCGDDDFTIFKMLFKYELFDATHKCICDAIKTGKVRQPNKEDFLKNL